MCGIISYIGNKQATPILFEGLKQLEYRGYDSAGIALYDKKQITAIKKVGRVDDLVQKSKSKLLHGNLGIAHTRWATHGEPSDINAHPHSDCKGSLWIVHNGIIENFRELRQNLKTEGHIFKSATDTEILSHLIEEHLIQEKNFFEAFRNALRMVKGTYGVAAISKQHPDQFVIAKNGSPLLIGVGKNEMFAASDVAAVLRYTDRVIYLDDGESALITQNNFVVKPVNGKKAKDIQKRTEKIEWDYASMEKEGFDHYLIKEISEQPRAVMDTMRGRIEIEEGIAHLGGLDDVKDRLPDIKRIIIISCGTARYCGLVGEYMLEEYAGIPVEVEYASEFRYRKPLINRHTACLFLSQSGETADTIAALKEAKRKGALTLGIVNVVGSTIARITDAGVYTHAGPEISVASTKAFVTGLTVLAILTLQFGRQKDMSLVMGKRIASELSLIPKHIQRIIDQREVVARIAKKYASYDNFLFLGRKYNYPIALEGALKLKELSYIHAEGYPTGEMKHGPIALIDPRFPSLFIAPQDSVYEKVWSGMEEIKARSGNIIAIATEGDTKITKLADEVVYIPKTLEMLTPMLTVIPMQLFSYYVALARKLDIDKPRNLAKSVTVE